MEDKISNKFRNSYKDEYNALFEAIFGQPDSDDEEFQGLTDDDEDKGEEKLEHPYELPNTTETVAISKASNSNTSKIVEQPVIEDNLTWSCIPDLLLENIFINLSLTERFNAALVCKHWSNAFHLSRIWNYFHFHDKSLTRKLFNYYSGWQFKLDHVKTQICLYHIGKHIRTLVLKPNTNFHNLYEFINFITYFSQQQQNPHCSIKGIGSKIRRLHYVFPCNMAKKNETARLYGTGGKLLDAVKKLMISLPSLQILELEDLMLDSFEAQYLLDEICYSHCYKLKKLKLVNISKIQCPLMHAGVFLNLEVLTISPQSLSDDILQLISDTKLKHLHILQNSYTTTDIKSCSSRAWKLCKKQNTQLRIHLQIQSINEQEMLWQDGAPTSSVLFDSPKIRPKLNDISFAVNNYKQTLRVFGYMSLTRYYQSRVFSERIDNQLIYACQHCPNLRTIVTREKISTETILLMVYISPKLQNLYVRKNLVMLKPNWPRIKNLDDLYYDKIKMNSKSHEATEREVSLILGYKWKMLSDKEFLSLSINLHY